MTLLRTDIELSEDTILRVVNALRLGLYRIAALPDGIAAVDLHHETQRLTCDAVRDVDGGTLPDVEMKAGTRRWTDVSSIRPEASGFERREALLRRHGEIAVAVLSAPPIGHDETSRIRELMTAIAVTCDAPVEGGWAVIAEAPTPWSPLRVDRIPSRLGPSPSQPDPAFAALVPQIATTAMRSEPDERPTILVDSLQAYVSPGEGMDAVSALRILSAARARD